MAQSNILIIEDNEAIRNLAKASFHKLYPDAEIEAIETIDEVVARLDSTHPSYKARNPKNYDLIFSDNDLNFGCVANLYIKLPEAIRQKFVFVSGHPFNVLSDINLHLPDEKLTLFEYGINLQINEFKQDFKDGKHPTPILGKPYAFVNIKCLLDTYIHK